MRPVTPTYTVSPQIAPEDAAAIAAAGYTDVINNRPDGEIPVELGSAAVRAAVEAAGLVFHDNPVTNGAMTLDNLADQARIMEASKGPVFAYCRSGTRCTIVWALTQAGRMPAHEIVATAARAGYDVTRLHAQLERPLI